MDEDALQRCTIAWLHIAADHPALPGHFPAQPLVPGVLLLAHVQALLDEVLPAYRLRTLPTVKFLQPVLPDMALLMGVELQTLDEQEVRGRFALRHRGQLMAQGQFITEKRSANPVRA